MQRTYQMYFQVSTGNSEKFFCYHRKSKPQHIFPYFFYFEGWWKTSFTHFTHSLNTKVIIILIWKQKNIFFWFSVSISRSNRSQAARISVKFRQKKYHRILSKRWIILRLWVNLMREVSCLLFYALLKPIRTYFYFLAQIISLRFWQ